MIMGCENCLCDCCNENLQNGGECDTCNGCIAPPKNICPDNKYRDDNGDGQGN